MYNVIALRFCLCYTTAWTTFALGGNHHDNLIHVHVCVCYFVYMQECGPSYLVWHRSETIWNTKNLEVWAITVDENWVLVRFQTKVWQFIYFIVYLSYGYTIFSLEYLNEQRFSRVDFHIKDISLFIIGNLFLLFNPNVFLFFKAFVKIIFIVTM